MQAQNNDFLNVIAPINENLSNGLVWPINIHNPAL
jgi:hypothetical protein